MNPLNPTKTKTIEKNWFKEIRSKYSSLQKDIDDKLEELSGPINVNVTLGMDSSQQRAFIAWLEQRVLEVTGEQPPLNWQSKYQLEAYLRAIGMTRASLISQGADLIPTTEELAAAQGFTFTSTPSLGSAAVAPVIHQDALAFLFSRAYDSLKGWNDKFVRDVRQLTFDAVKDGTGIRELSVQIKERTGVTERRAELIARTETGQAYSESAYNETDRAYQELGEGQEGEGFWLSALLPTTRHRHAGFHGQRMKTSRARRIRSGQENSSDPYNCRCGWSPIAPGVSTEKKEGRFKIQRAEFMEWEKKQDGK